MTHKLKRRNKMNTDKIYAESIAKEYAYDIVKLAREISEGK